jgi:hypothetical protein
VLRTAAALKRQGRSVRAICLDFHSTGGDKVTYRNWLKGLAIDLGLNEQAGRVRAQDGGGAQAAGEERAGYLS